MSYLRTKGLVLKEIDTGDADKIVVLFTANKGKLSAAARGARRTKSALSPCTQVLGYNEYFLFGGKEMYSINSGEVIEPFYEIRNDIVKLTYAAHFIDIVLDTLQDEQPQQKILKLLLNSLHFLSKTEKEPALIARIFELRFLTLSGYAPITECCVFCGADGAEAHNFSFEMCGFLCRNGSCNSSDISSYEISEGARKAIRHIVCSNADEVFCFSVSDEVQEELAIINRRYLREMLDKDYTKLDMLKSFKV